MEFREWKFYLHKTHFLKNRLKQMQQEKYANLKGKKVFPREEKTTSDNSRNSAKSYIKKLIFIHYCNVFLATVRSYHQSDSPWEKPQPSYLPKKKRKEKKEVLLDSNVHGNQCP